MRHFVVQQHHASHAHFDFRLELDGVLKSWAVPKGPSLDPAIKRLAVQVEDHPIEYASFEGTIPKGQYGGGSVIVWDNGSWAPATDESPAASLRAGKLKFTLHGKKLKGGWMLVRTRTRDSSKPQWLLIKEHDRHARSESEFDVVLKRPRSVQSGRAIEEIGKQLERVWSSDSDKQPSLRRAPASDKRLVSAQSKRITRSRTTTPKAASNALSRLTGSVLAPFPRSLSPQLATRTSEVPSGDEWAHEVKFDGYRILARLDGSKVKLITRKALDWASRFPELTRELQACSDEAVLDGEVVALDPSGVSRFQGLQHSLSQGRTASLRYFVFDLLYWNGYDLRGCALRDRRAALKNFLAAHKRDTHHILMSEEINGDGNQLIAHACRLGLEGIVSKRLNSPYLSARTTDWRKIRCHNRQEMIVIGFTEPQRSRVGIGALLLGIYSGKRLTYAGKVGTGFDTNDLKSIRESLGAVEVSRSPLASIPGEARSSKTHWVKPVKVAEVEFSEWTRDGRLRHPVFLAWREDKDAREIVREKPLPSAKPSASRVSKKAPQRTTVHLKSRQNAPTPTAERDSMVEGVEITHPDRLMFKDCTVTKLQLARYYSLIAPLMMPLAADRPLSLVRCPQGASGPSFFQKHPEVPAASGLHVIKVQEKSGITQYAVATEPRGIVHFVQLNTVEFHGWGSRADKPDLPDRLVFDLDPGEGVKWARVVEAAELVRDTLQKLDLVCFLKTTGGKGLHVVIPIKRGPSWDRVKALCHAVADAMATRAPNLYTATMSKAKRPGRVFVDYLRNQRGATSVLPYSVRARPGAPVSKPISWRGAEALSPRDFTVDSLSSSIPSISADAWSSFERSARKLPRAK